MEGKPVLDTSKESIDITIEAVCVRGGLYEVDVRNKESYPVYWNRKYCSLMGQVTFLYMWPWTTKPVIWVIFLNWYLHLIWKLNK